MSALNLIVTLARRRLPVDPGRSGAARYLGPASLLLVATVVVLVVRTTVRSDAAPAAKAPAHATTGRAAHRPPRTHLVPAPKRYYVIAVGDTLGAVAARFGTSVDALMRLNPGIEPTALRPGEHVRVE